MSGAAAGEIKNMLDASVVRVNGIVTDSRNSIMAMTAKGHEAIEHGVSLAERSGEILAGVVSNVNRVNEMMSQISQAQDEQAAGIRQIAQAMHDLDSVTHSNSDTAATTSELADSLAGQAGALRDLVFDVEAELLGKK
jgi:methyl-accepting chemotaxis protein